MQGASLLDRAAAPQTPRTRVDARAYIRLTLSNNPLATR
jgi:hypothetical protein